MVDRPSSPSPDETPPEGWRVASLSDLAEIRFSSVDKKSVWGELPVRLCNYTDVYFNDYVTASMDFMRATATRSELERFALFAGDVVITKDSETPDDIGVPALIDSSAEDLLCGYHLAIIRSKSSVDPTFLAKQLSQPRIRQYFGRQANGTTRYGLAAAAIDQTPIWVPPIDQQRAIGQSARLIDAAIKTAAALVTKLKLMRVGMLHDLITYGLDENGRARDPNRQPDAFRVSPVGRIPQVWRVLAAEQFGDVRLGRQRSPAHENGGHMRPYLRVANVFDGFIDYSDVLRMNFEPGEQATYGLEPGDILLNEGQSLELVGRSAIYDGPAGVYCFQNTLVRFRCNTEALPEFCQPLFKYTLDRGRFMSIAKQTTSVAHLGADRFAKMLFPLPPMDEQIRIADTLRSMDARLHAEARELAKLRSMKLGLMDDLLSGRVSIPIPEEAEVAV
ncbi:MAG: restriction endonuclease subunit S [Phycisphaerales bacterium JB054]